MHYSALSFTITINRAVTVIVGAAIKLMEHLYLRYLTGSQRYLKPSFIYKIPSSTRFPLKPDTNRIDKIFAKAKL